MKLAFFESYANDARNLANSFPELETSVIEETLNPLTATSAGDPDIISVFIESVIDRPLLDQLPTLKLVAIRSTGYDNIDVEACTQRGIAVANVPLYGANTVAEHAFALMLALSRKILQSYERTERLNFEREGLQGFDLYGKTLGVIGTGAIGAQVVRIGQAIGMKLLAYDIAPRPELVEKYGLTYVTNIEDLLSQSHVITLHVPLNRATFHLINADTLAKVRPGALLINTARGAIVDTQALLEALESGIISGAGLDVLEGESETYEDIALLSRSFPKSKDVVAAILRNHILVARDDVIITPHNAFNSAEAVQRLFDVTVDNIRSWLAGQPTHVVNPAVLSTGPTPSRALSA